MDGTLIDSVGIWNQIDQKLIEKLANKTIDETTVQNDRDTQLKIQCTTKSLFMLLPISQG